MVTLWKFDRGAGRIDMKKSFAIELPPYWQDLFDAGKLASDGWIFGNSINTEMATGGIEEGKPPFEAGVSQRDVDYLHIINLKAAEAAYLAGKTKMVNGFPVIPLDVAAKDGILFFAPEPKSPHGCDVTPNGKYIVVAGKLDPHVSVYSFEKIQATIAAKKWTPAEKLRVVVEASQLSDEDLGEFLRREGLHEAQLKEWWALAESAFVDTTRSSKRSPEARRIKELEWEVRRKDKALAEASALLILKKKVEAIWGAMDDDTTNEKDA